MLSTVPGVALFVPQTGLGFELKKKNYWVNSLKSFGDKLERADYKATN